VAATNKNGEPKRRSYHLNSIYPEWISFADVAIAFLQAKGNADDFQKFVNAWLAEPFFGLEDQEEMEKALVAVRSAKAEKKVPEGHIALITVDVQQDSVWYVVRAHAANRDSVLLDQGTAPSPEDIEHLVKRWGAFAGGMDRRFSQQQVLEWCFLRPGWYPMLGAGGMFSSIRWVMAKIDGGTLQGREVRSLNWRPHDFKEEWHHRVRKIGKGRPAWLAGETISETYKRHMLGEARMERKGVVEWIKRHANHLFDCEMMQLALFEGVRVFAFSPEALGETKFKPPPGKPAEPPDPQSVVDQGSGDREDLWGQDARRLG